MTLAAPAFLAVLALLVPVVLVFLVRRRTQVLRVPSTMVWRLAARSVAKSRRFRDLRRLLSLVACLLAIAALAVAAARPTGTRREGIVFVVDVSASMDGAPLRDARAYLTREVAGLGADSRVAIITGGGIARVALPFVSPGPQLEQAIAGLGAEKEFASLEDAITLATGLTNGDARARIVVVSDQPIDRELSRGGKTMLAQRIFSRSPAAADNIGIVGLYTRALPEARDDGEREAMIAIATSSADRVRHAHLVVTLAGRTVGDRRVAIDPRGETTERVGIRGGGRLVARVRPDDGANDALAIDDEASLDEAAYPAPRVALVRPHEASASAASFFIERAIRAAGVTDLMVVDALDPAPTRAEVAVILAEGSGRPKDVPSFLVGVEPRELGLSTRVVEKTATRLRSVSSEEPVLRGVAFDELDAVRARVVPAPPPFARTLVALDGGAALLAGGAGKHAWIWMGLDPDGSDLVLRVAFPVLVGNVLADLAGTAQVASAKTAPRSEVQLVGDPVRTPLAAAPEPAWRASIAPAAFLAAIGALLLALEVWLGSKRTAALRG
jgi:hypothetical protein